LMNPPINPFITAVYKYLSIHLKKKTITERK